MDLTLLKGVKHVDFVTYTHNLHYRPDRPRGEAARKVAALRSRRVQGSSRSPQWVNPSSLLSPPCNKKDWSDRCEKLAAKGVHSSDHGMQMTVLANAWEFHHRGWMNLCLGPPQPPPCIHQKRNTIQLSQRSTH